MNHPCTREGEKFAGALAGPDNGPGVVKITGHRPCTCGHPSCAITLHGVGITIDGVFVLATSPKAVDGIIYYLRQAAEFAWGKP